MRVVKRDKFFYVSPKLMPDYPYKSRLAIGMKFEDYRWINDPIFSFEIRGNKYEIERERAIELGSKYTLSMGVLPNLIPKEEFKEVTNEDAI